MLNNAKIEGGEPSSLKAVKDAAYAFQGSEKSLLCSIRYTFR